MKSRQDNILVKFDIIALSLFSIFYIVVNYIWLSENRLWPSGDAPGHIMSMLQLYHPVIDHNVERLISNILVPSLYPPVVFLVSIPFHLVFGMSHNVSIMSQSVFIPVFIFSIFLIGLRLWGRATGWAMVLLGTTAPVFAMTSRNYLLDMPLTAFCALTLYLLLLTEKFTDRKASILFGIALGVTLMIKWAGLFFLTVPVLYFAIPVIYRAARRSLIYIIPPLILFLFLVFLYMVGRGNLNMDTHRQFGIIFLPIMTVVIIIWIRLGYLAWRKSCSASQDDRNLTEPAGNLFFSLALVIALTGPWYVYNLPAFFYCKDFIAQNCPIMSLENFKAYSILTFDSFSFAGFLLITGVLISLILKKERERNLVFILSLLASIVFLIYNISGSSRYFLPCIIFVIILAVFWLRYILPEHVLIILCAVVGFWQLLGWSLVEHYPEIPTGFYHIQKRHPMRLVLSTVVSELPDKRYYPADKVIQTLSDSEARFPRPVQGDRDWIIALIMVSDKIPNINDIFQYFANRYRLSVEWRSYNFTGDTDEYIIKIKEDPPHFVIFVDDLYYRERTEKIDRFIGSQKWKLLKEFQMPEEGYIKVYRTDMPGTIP